MRPRAGRLRAAVRFLAAGALLLALAGCQRQPADSARHVRETILKARLAGMTELVTTLKDSLLTSRNLALISMDQKLLEQLVGAAVPFRRTLAGNVVVDVDSARVQCQDGLALVRLVARASLGGDSASSAEMTIHAALRQVDFDPESGLLRGRIEVIASETKRVHFMGLDKSMKELVRTLARLRTDALAPLNYTVEIPLRLAGAVKLPEIGAEGGDIRIPAARIPLLVAIRPVMALHGKLWIPIELSVPREGTPPFSVEVAPDAVEKPHRRWRPMLPWRRRTILLHEYDLRRGEAERLLKGDPYLSGALADSAALGLALPLTLLDDLIAAISRRYLDHVDVNIPAGKLTVHESGDMKVKTFLGRMTAADWTAVIDPLALHGTLSAGTPEVVRATGANRLHIVMPVTLRGAGGSGRIAFHWDPHGLANLACSNFDQTLDISGTVASHTYAVRGDFVLAAEGDHLTALPDFPADRFTLVIQPSADTWRRVAQALEAEDRGKCGLFFDSEDCVARLKALCADGFKVKLPRSIFRSVTLPASFNRTVDVAGRAVQLSMRPRALRITPLLCWYSADADACPDSASTTSAAR